MFDVKIERTTIGELTPEILAEIQKQTETIFNHLQETTGSRLDIATMILSHALSQMLIMLYKKNGHNIVDLRDYLELFKSTALDNFTALANVDKPTT